ncbi:MAG: DUF4957 domain-containing protein [Bacteroidales bacterium]|nr:DUF4957 domain-containing protein [Bacteroidales bacterium]
MKYKNIFKAAAAALAAFAMVTGCTEKEFDEITELNLSRCLEPQNLSAKIDVATGDNVTFAWDVNKDADTYNLVVYTDEAMTKEALNVTIAADEVPYTVRLTADEKYYFKVQALSGTRNPSVWAVYDGSTKTYAVKDNLFLEVVDRTANSISLTWSSDAADYTEVTHLSAVPVKGGSAIEVELSESEAAGAAAVVTGLDASTEYQITLFYLSASRGSVDTWTRAEQGSATRVTNSEDLIALMTAGDDIYLALSGSPYTINNVKPAGSVKVVGELGADGTKPVVTGKIELTADLAANSSIYLEGIKFDGGAANSRLIEHTGGSPVLTSIKVVNCEITNFQAGLFYGNNDNVVKIGEFTFDSCDMYDILGSGGDAFDVRKTTEIENLTFVNNTIYDGIRTMFRIDASDAIVISKFNFENNTVKNIATMDDGNNRGFFAIRVPTDMTLKKNLFLFENGGKTEDVDRAQLFQVNNATVVPTLTASDNYSYASGKDFFNKVSAAAAGFTELEADPCYNAKGNFFQLSNQDLIAAKVGASKWWISYVEKEEDLTQNVITSAHTWNLQNASLFVGEVKNSRVRDELLLVGTEANPMNADGGINFLAASTLTRKGIPTEGYISFKVNAPGSVDLLVSDPGKTGSSVVVALADDNGFTVQGGAVASTSNGGVQKIIVKPVSGEGTVYLYSTGAISITKLAWSEDANGGSPVLAAPKPVVEPVTLTEGDATAVTVTWEAVPNAASYAVIFNKRAADPQTGLSFTVDAETIAELKAGLYSFTVQALPSDEDIYYTKSELGSASIAIQPKAGEGGTEETHVLTWDFSAADWQAEFAKVGASNTDITGWNLSYDGLTIVSSAKSKYNTTFFQWGGGGSDADRYMTFTAPEQGTLKVWASNTGNNEDLSRLVAVKVGDDEQTQPGGYASGSGAVEIEFSINAGEVKIYPSGNGLRFYKIEFTYTTISGGSTPVEYDWNFEDSDWQAEFAKVGASNTDITGWNLTYNGLTIVSSAKSKYNTTFFQWGGGGSDADRYMTFTAPEQGTLKVWASNTGNNEDLSRLVAVKVGDDEQTQPGGYASGSGAVEIEFSIKAGEVKIYPSGNGLRFYHIYYTNQ